ncbi:MULTISPECIES: helix-turn-helix transcriptional regulator [Actinosynnema]|uniref:helix-turn-helix transcriptional regulator n=1 Tax=Actinosynnema TaxID=40566 RepID=UPI0020A51928|nr:helix-turn-helix transcriptional regulator [Actinosynnema pretiosum]MCP2093119.1 Helix-turn-helix domain-containing protein [Actinosynnema pretiosum]
MSARELAGFLRARRESLGPAQVGLRRAPSSRTPGLRREEVASLAGVTVNYYERVEQGRAPHPSPQVLDALGAALRLTGAEREHLARLAGHAPVGEEPEPGVPEAVRTLLDGLGATPAYAVTPALDVVAWNAAAVALFTDFAELPASERGLAALSRRFGGTLCGEVEPGAFAERAAADLRAAAVRFPGLGAARVAEEFGAHSPEFAAAWAARDVRERPVVRKVVAHPVVGRLELDVHALVVPGHDLRVVLHTARPGGASAERLARLVTGDRGQA